MGLLEAAERYAAAVQSHEMALRAEQVAKDAHDAAYASRDASYEQMRQATRDLLDAAKTPAPPQAVTPNVQQPR